MLRILSFSVVLFFLASACGTDSSSSDTANDTSSEVTDSDENLPVIEPIKANTISGVFYIINVSAFENQEDASNEVRKMRKIHVKCNYLWIPDFGTLSGKKLWSVFLGPFENEFDCLKYLSDYQNNDKNAYGVLVAQYPTRFTFHSVLDRRTDNVKKFGIVIYSTKADEEAYAAEGGEDWGFFVNEVQMYFENNYSQETFVETIKSELFTDAEHKSVVEKSGAERFGYILVKGNAYRFIPHDLPDSVVSQICDFFGLVKVDMYGEEGC